MKYLKAYCLYVASASIVFCGSCKASSSNIESQCIIDGQQQTVQEFVDYLVKFNHTNLFAYEYKIEGVWHHKIDLMWDDSETLECLEKVALDPNAPNQARFLAAETLFHKREDYPPESIRNQLVPVYAKALESYFSEGTVGNGWAVPGDGNRNGSLGVAGENLVRFGEEIIPFLIPLLDNENSVEYSGSVVSAHGALYQFRVKDLAAFFIAEIRGLDYETHLNPAYRDRDIERLRSSL